MTAHANGNRTGHRSSPPTDFADQIAALQLAFVDCLSDTDLGDAARQTAALRLLERARATAFPGIAVRALEWMLGRLVDEKLTEPGDLGDPAERACARLLAAGKVDCPTCLRTLPDRESLRVWAARRHLTASWRDRLRGFA